MTYVVAFSGSPLSRAALARAARFARAADERVLAVSAVPRRNAEYARERGWLGEAESWGEEGVVDHLREAALDVSPAAEFRYETVDRYAPRGTIAGAIRDVAHAFDAAVVFVGSENAGRVVGSLVTVGGNVASDPGYDVHIVRRLDGAG